MPRPLRSLLTLLLLVLAACGRPTPTPEPPPNIVFIFTDDHSARAISAYGSEINQTPNIDRLAAEGMRFANCFVTNAICAPSRATILTGLYSHANGQLTNQETFDGSQRTFPKLLQEAGYQTALIGKWHLKSAPTGFDHWQVLIGQGPYYNPPIRTATDTTVIPGYTTNIITDLSLDWLQNQRDPARPFMLMVQHKAPHRRWEPGPDHLTLYDDQTIPIPDTFFDDYEGRASPAAEANMRIDENLTALDLKIVPPNNLTEEQLEAWNAAYGPKNEALRERPLEGEEFARWKYQRYIKDYLRTVASVDDNIGRLLDYLDQTGLAENTVVIYTSDQGWYLGEHGWYDKRWMYEESLRTPLIVRWPAAVEAGAVSYDMVSNVDFAATFLDLAGATIPADLHGRSLKPILLGQAPDDWRDSFYYHYYEYPASHCVQRHYGVRTERYKLIYYYLVDEWELFDLHEDPDELTSVYDDPAYADVVSDLKAELQRLRTELNVPDDDRPSGDCTFDAEGWDGFEAG
ncbi:sulfatase [Rhodothermaceae bacterium RA]|nr:sulfatase [Rhodothermaceae bacterium RA]